MAIKKYYAGSQGPFTYEDTDALNDPDGDFAGADRQAFITDGSGTIASSIITDLTASRLMATDADKRTASVADLTDWIAGTTDQVTVTDDTDGTVTLSLPQDIATDSDVEFNSITLDTTVELSNVSGDLKIVTDTDKTIYLDKFVWEDMRIVPGQLDRPGTTDPTYRAWQPGGSGTTYQVLKFDQEQLGYFTIQLPHSYAIGEDIYCHLHWTPGDRGVTEDTKTVAWKVDYSWASINGVFAASTPLDLTDTCDGVNDKHLMTQEVVLDGTDKGISSMLVCKVYRDTGDTWVGTGANGPALLEIDFHFPVDTMGSRQIGAK